jgi:hypothetical protein
MVPISIDVHAPAAGGGTSRSTSYRMRMVNDRFLSPFLLQMAIHSALDATERTLGAATVSMRGQVEFNDGTAPLRLDDMYVGETNLRVSSAPPSRSATCCKEGSRPSR